MVLTCIFSVSAAFHLVFLSGSNNSNNNSSISNNVDTNSSGSNVVQHMKAVASTVPRDTQLFEEELLYLRNARAMSQQREHLESLCQDERSKEADRSWWFSSASSTSKRYMEEAFAAALDPPATNKVIAAAVPTPVQPCDRVFWDLGANIGDTLIDFTEAGFRDLSCHPDDIRALNLASGRITDSMKTSNKDSSLRGAWLGHHAIRRSDWASLGDWTAHRMKQAFSRRHPEDYCYFGLEVSTKNCCCCCNCFCCSQHRPS